MSEQEVNADERRHMFRSFHADRVSDPTSSPMADATTRRLLADAWDEGNIAGIFDLPSPAQSTPNPYKAKKKCAHCGEMKPLSEFGMKGHLVRSYCIPCDKDYKKDHKARVLLKPERHRAWQDSVNDAQDKNQQTTRAKATEHYGSWTESDDGFLRANWNMPRKEVALHLGRTYAAVATRKLKLKKISEQIQP